MLGNYEEFASHGDRSEIVLKSFSDVANSLNNVGLDRGDRELTTSKTILERFQNDFRIWNDVDSNHAFCLYNAGHNACLNFEN